MAKITVYLSDEVAAIARRQAKKERLSISRWVASIVERHANAGPRPGILNAIGAFPDFPTIEELRHTVTK